MQPDTTQEGDGMLDVAQWTSQVDLAVAEALSLAIRGVEHAGAAQYLCRLAANDPTILRGALERCSKINVVDQASVAGACVLLEEALRLLPDVVDMAEAG